MCQVQFSNHAIERVLDRLAGVTSYGEVQSAVSKMSLLPGDHQVIVKRLPAPKIIRTTGTNGVVDQMKGDKVVAYVHADRDGATVVTVALNY